MRTSKRNHILESALKVVEAEGVGSVTFESVAMAAGLSKGGLLYHFPTKEAMLLALHEYLAHEWEAELMDALVDDPTKASEAQKAAAYARVSVRAATGPELLLMLEARRDPALSQPWNEVMSRWAPDPVGLDATDSQAISRLVAYLAADGLWLSSSLRATPLTEDVREAVAQRIIAAIDTLDSQQAK